MATAETRATRMGSSNMVTRMTDTIAIPNSRVKSLHALGDDARLVGDELQLHIGRQRGLHARQGFVQLLAELYDIVSLVHLDREQDGRFAADACILGRVLVDALHIGKIAQVDGLSGRRHIDHDLPDLLFGLERAIGLDGKLAVSAGNAAAKHDGVAALQTPVRLSADPLRTARSAPRSR